MKKLQVTVLIIISLFVANISQSLVALGYESPQCDQVLNACDKALEDQLKLNHDKQRIIEAQDKLTETQRLKIDELKSENSSIFKSPYLWFGLGVLTTVIIRK